MRNPQEILNTWLKSVNDGEIETLLSLYHESAVLIPTFSNRILNDPKKIQAYFEKLNSREELCVALHEKTIEVQTITDTIHSVSGIYCWRFAVDDEMLSFEARFSFVLDLSLENPILHHHSSQIPRMI